MASHYSKLGLDYQNRAIFPSDSDLRDLSITTDNMTVSPDHTVKRDVPQLTADISELVDLDDCNSHLAGLPKPSLQSCSYVKAAACLLSFLH